MYCWVGLGFCAQHVVAFLQLLPPYSIESPMAVLRDLHACGVIIRGGGAGREGGASIVWYVIHTMYLGEVNMD